MSLKYSTKTIVRITIILMIINHISSIIEYNIHDELGLSFLKYTSINFNDTIISSDLKFNLSLTRIIGTLLYAIDSQQNQLILSLHGNINERLQIKFRGVDNYIYLEKLCGCKRCKYQWLSIHIKIENNIKIKCNQEKFQEFSYNERQQLSSDYPVLNKSEKFVIYFINTPKHENGYPNSEQLQGCIKDVLLNGKSMDLIPFPKTIPKCERSCTNEVCNGGKCHETFFKKVICECSDSDSNGEYCNSTMLNGSITNFTNQKNRKLKFIKLTWKSNSTNILKIIYRNFNFSIKYENSSLIAEYEERNEFIKGIFKNIGNASTNFRLFILFNNTSVHCTLITPHQTVSGEFAVPRDISKENITSLKLLNGNCKIGEIDIAYKNDLLEYTWKSVINLAVPPICEDEPKPNKYPESTNNSIKTGVNEPIHTWKCIILTIEVVLILISIMIWICICKKRSKDRERRPMSKSTEATPLNPLENRENVCEII